MRNNVNGNGMINGGYVRTSTNQNVIQNPYFNPEVQIPNGTFITSPTYFGSPQQLAYPAMYNQVPSYYQLGMINYATQNPGLPNGQILVKPNSYPNQMCNVPSGLNVVDPNTLSQINLSKPNTTVVPKRKSALQIIDPNTKSEIDVTKLVLEKKSSEADSLKESYVKKNEEEFKFNFDIDKDDKTSLPVVEECKDEEAIAELSTIPDVKETSENPECQNVMVEKIELINLEEKSEKVVTNYDEIDLKNALYETKEDESDFTEVVNKKKKKQQSKIVSQEKAKVIEKPVSKFGKKEVNGKNSGFGKKNIDEKNQKSSSSNESKPEKTDDVSNPKEVSNYANKNNSLGNQQEIVPVEDRTKQNNTLEGDENKTLSNKSKYNRVSERNGFDNRKNGNDYYNNNRKQNLQQKENNNNRHPAESRECNGRPNDSRNSSISRNYYNNNYHNGKPVDSRESSVRRNESRESSIRRNDNQYNNNRIQQQFDKREGGNINKSSGNLQNGHQNESRDSSVKRNDNYHNGQSNENRELGYRRNNNRYQNNHQTRRNEHNNKFCDNSNIQRNDSKVDFSHNSRNDYNGNRNNSHRNGNAHFSRQDSRNGQRYYNSGDKNIDNSRPPIRKEDGNHLVENCKPDSEISPEFKVPLDFVDVKPKIKYQKAFRKSSSPLVMSLVNCEPEREVKVTEVEESMKNMNIESKNEVIGKQTKVLGTNEIKNDDCGQMISPVNELIVENEEVKHERSSETVTPFLIEENKDEAVIKEDIDENFITDGSTEEVKQVENLEVEDNIENEISIEITVEIKEQSEIVSVEKDESVKVVSENMNQLIIESSQEMISKELISPAGRLTYYRDYLMSLRGNQTVPQSLLNDPSLVEVIYPKIQILNFLKKEIFVKPQTHKTDYLDFTRRNHNIQPKRLIRGENGYLPPQLRQVSDDKMKNLKRNIKSILNKMTPENFEICTSEIVHLDIDDEENMKCLIDEIFLKAIQEESYSSTYVKFCAHMCAVRVGKDTFKTLLLRKCQNMFEKPLHLQLEDVRTLWQEKADNEKDERIKKLYESDIEEQVKKAKDKYFGNIRFFSELFLANQLAGNIILSCANQLLKYDKDNNSLEAVCKLLQICGGKLEQKQALSKDKRFADIMAQILILSNRADIEPRLRFKLKDIVDMQKRGWELRGIQKAIASVPKTLEEMKDERIKLEMENAKANYNHNNSNVRHRPSVQRSVMDTKKFQLETQNLTKETVLGPQIRTQWGSGCKSNGANTNGWNSVQSHRKPVVSASQTVVTEKSAKITLQNKYAQLCEETKDLPIKPSVEVISTESVSKTTGVDETISIELFDLIMKRSSPLDRWKELVVPVAIIDKWFYLMFDRKLDCRVLLGDYFHDLIHSGFMSYDQFIEGSVSTMNAVDDIIDDVPNFWLYLAQFMERFIKSEQSDLTFFNELFKVVVDQESSVEKCKKLIKESASQRLGSEVVEDLFMKYLP